jgi:hypothetical protein
MRSSFQGSPAMASCDGMYFAITNADASPTPAIKEAEKEKEKEKEKEDASVFRVLSIDVGMKNLAYCLFEVSLPYEPTKVPDSMMQLINIVAWDTVNLCDVNDSVSEKLATPLCSNAGCKFAAKFMHSFQSKSDDDEDGTIANTNYYCTRHANASGYKMPLSSSFVKSLKKMPLDELKTFSAEYLSVPIPAKCEKSKLKLMFHLNASIAAEYLVAVTTKPNVVSAASVDLITIGRNMHRRFDALPHLASGIDVVIIENQLSTLATRMKTLQGMITQYFIMRGVPDIRFISATNKLKLFSKEGEDKGDKTDYADRKKRSMEITRALIAEHAPEHIGLYDKHKKKDDLADCFLQGVWWLGTCRP